MANGYGHLIGHETPSIAPSDHYHPVSGNETLGAPLGKRAEWRGFDHLVAAGDRLDPDSRPGETTGRLARVRWLDHVADDRHALDHCLPNHRYVRLTRVPAFARLGTECM